MPEAFNPYHKWLGIPPEEQPPNHYRLLGLKLYENDADAISNACDQRMGHVKPLAAGAHAKAAEKILNRLAAARVCLLDRQSKRAYDDALRSMLARRVEAKAGSSQSVAMGKGEQSTFGEYQLLELTGGGSTGAIWKAKHLRLDKVVTLKTMPPGASESSELVKRFQREIKITARLDHPNVVWALDAGQHQGVHFLVTHYVHGTDLLTLVREHGPLSPEQAIGYMIQAARGLQYLHEQGIYHRDVKPGNILLDEDGTVKVSNMLLARADAAEGAQDSLHDTLTRSGQTMGTADYLAPEQAIDAHRADHRSDIYALGCTMYRLITGHVPYPFGSLVQKVVAHRDHPVPAMCDVRADVPASVDRVFQKMAAKRPQDRYQSMAEVIAALEGCSAGLPLPYLLIGAGVGLAVLVVLLILIF